MNICIRKTIGKLGVIALIVAGFYLLFAPLLPAVYIMAIDDAEYLKDELDNPYINQDFEDFIVIELTETADGVAFLVPNDWTFSEDSNGMIRVTDGSSKFTAYGTVFGQDDSAYSNENEFLSALEGKTVTETTENSVPDYVPIFNTTRSSTFGSVSVMGGGDYYYLSLYADSLNDHYFYLLFMPDPYVQTEQFTNIIQAISYSNSFPEVWKVP